MSDTLDRLASTLYVRQSRRTSEASRHSGAPIRTYAELRERGIDTLHFATFDTGRMHGPDARPDCGCGWGTLCDGPRVAGRCAAYWQRIGESLCAGNDPHGIAGADPCPGGFETEHAHGPWIPRTLARRSWDGRLFSSPALWRDASYALRQDNSGWAEVTDPADVETLRAIFHTLPASPGEYVVRPADAARV